MDPTDFAPGGRSNWEEDRIALPNRKGPPSKPPPNLYAPDMPSIPHPPRRSPPPASIQMRTQDEHRPIEHRPLEHRPKGSLPHGQQLYTMGLSPAQLQARQQLITAYMMQNGGVAAGNQPFFLPPGGFPALPPHSPQVPPEASPAPKYTEVETIVAKLRENMLKVLKSPNYKRCKSAKNIRQALREVRSLCKDMRNETTEMGKQKGNAKKKAATPEGEERQAKKQKGEEKDGETIQRVQEGPSDAKNPEEVRQEGEGQRTEGDTLQGRPSQEEPVGVDEKELRVDTEAVGVRDEDRGTQKEQGMHREGVNGSSQKKEQVDQPMQEPTSE